MYEISNVLLYVFHKNSMKKWDSEKVNKIKYKTKFYSLSFTIA